MRRLRRALAFGRRIPPRQIGRRAWLALLRRADRRLRPSLAAKGLRTARSPPPPILPKRRSGVEANGGGGWSWRFLGRTTDLGAVDWRSPGDRLWRMTLHYMEYLEALPDDEAARLIGEWIAANPPYRPGSEDGWSAYALSLRAVVWMQQLAGRRLPPDLAAAAEASLAAQLRYLERHLETDVGGNHLIKNLKALLWGSAYFEGPAAERWRRTALRLLARELPLQVLPDGVHFELSPSYHCQVFADLVEIRHALAGDPLGGALDEALERMAQAAADLAHPDGRVALFGDSGLATAYPPGQCLEAYARLCGTAPAARKAFALAAAGYWGVRDGGCYAVADAGRIAPPALPAHGHGDIGSFEWSVDGQRIVVDQGVFDYAAGPRRDFSRSAASHNTLLVEGGDQGEFFGSFRCGRMARPTVHRARVGDGEVELEVSHGGFARLPGAPVHRRRFELAPRRIRIDDRIEGRLERPARISLLLHPSAAVQHAGTGKVRLTCGKAAAEISASLPIVVEDAVWWPDMGVEEKTVRLAMALPPGTHEAWIELAADAPAAKGNEA